LLSFAINGAAATFPEYPVRPVSEYEFTAQGAGVIAAAHPEEDPKEQKTYFNTELGSKGFVPVFVVLRNDSGGSVLFRKDALLYGIGELEAVGNTALPGIRSQTGEKVGYASFAALSLGGAIIAMKLISNASQVQQNILKKELQSTTLAPGATAHGFVYIPVPKGRPRERIHLRISVSAAGSDENVSLELVF
jgi:hypothetical protein